MARPEESDFRSINKPLSGLSRREMLKLTGGAAVGSALFGCGTPTQDRNTVTIMTSLTGDKIRATDALVDEFSETHPTLRAEHIKVPWDQGHSKFLTTILGGNAPDLMVLPSQWFSEFRAIGAIEDLTPWFREWSHRDSYPETVVLWANAATAFEGDQVFGIPYEAAVRSMFYRQEWLDEHGLEPAGNREEWRTLLEKVTDPSSGRYGYAFRGARGGFYSWWAIAEEFSGTNVWFDSDHRCIINSKDHVAGLSYWNDIYQDGLAPPDSLNWGYNELVQAFWSGICGTMEQDPEVIKTCLEHGMNERTLTTTVMPAGPKARVSLADLGYMAMSSSSPRKEAAWEFLSWLAAPDQLNRYCLDVNMIPPFKQSMYDPSLGKGVYRAFLDMITDKTMLPNWYPNYLPQMGEFLEVRATEEHQNMLLKRQSPQDTLDKLADFMTQAEKKYVDKHGPETPQPPKIEQ